MKEISLDELERELDAIEDDERILQENNSERLQEGGIIHQNHLNVDPIEVQGNRESTTEEMLNQLMEHEGNVYYVDENVSITTRERLQDGELLTFDGYSIDLRNVMDKKYPHKCPMCGSTLQFQHMLSREWHTEEYKIRWINNGKGCVFIGRDYQTIYKKWKELKEIWKTQYKILTIKGKKIKIKQDILCCKCFDSFNDKNKDIRRMDHLAISLSNRAI